MHKELHLLGLLAAGPKTGYRLHAIVMAHGDLYTDLKKGNIYYLLDRLAQRGDLEVTAEAGAPGPRRERLVYALTDAGRARFRHLLREVLRTFELAHTGVEVGMMFLATLPPAEAAHLLEERRAMALAQRALLAGTAEPGAPAHPHPGQDYLLTLVDAELGWIGRTLRRLRAAEQPDGAPPDHGA
ncbi:MAG TPA: PadR family transcriptional regulator [Ktedonobacterales bacterium]|jgi:DNA-binding PadR family transcriptional regulator